LHYAVLWRYTEDIAKDSKEDAERYIAHLVGQVITVSVATVTLVNELVQAVRSEDWLGEAR
jgi:predicted helicase